MVDAPVIMQLEFQQSKFEKVKLPQVQFLDRALDIPVFPQRGVQLVQKTGDSPDAVLEEVVDTPVDVSTTGAMVQTVQKTVWRLCRVPQTSSSTWCGRSEDDFLSFLRTFFALRPFGRRVPVFVRSFWRALDGSHLESSQTWA